MFKTLKDTTWNRKLSNIYYGLYHWVVICFISNWKIATPFFFTYTSVAQSLEYIKVNYGWISACICHLGINVAVVLVCANVIYSEDKYALEQSAIASAINNMTS